MANHKRSLTDAPAWVGRTLIDALTREPGLALEIVHAVQVKAGVGLAGQLINALREAGVELAPPAKRELPPERLEQLRQSAAIARAAKVAKAKKK